MEKIRKKIDKKHFYDYYDKNVKQSNDYYIAVKFNLSMGQAKFGDSKEDKAAARFFSSLNREIEYYGSPDYMILGLAMQRLRFGFQEQSAGELLQIFLIAIHIVVKNLIF